MNRQSIHRAIFLIVMWLWPSVLAAETTVISPEAQPAWNAVGRVNKGGYDTATTCTGTLVAPDLVLTASHCVPGGDLSTEAASAYIFVAGWNRGDYAAAVPVAQVYRHPDQVDGPLNMDNLHRDIALLRLIRPIPADVAAPMILGARPSPEVPLGFIGYKNARRHAPELFTACPQSPISGLVFLVGCPVTSGHSGSPVLDMTPVGPRVVGVMAAQVGTSGGAIGFQPWMRAYLSDLP